MGVDLTSESVSHPGEHLAQPAEADVADDQEIDVAIRSRGAAGDRSEDEGHADFRMVEGLAKQVCQAGGLDDQAVDVGIEGMPAIGAVERAVPVAPDLHEPQAGEPSEFLPHRAVREPGLPSDLANMQFACPETEQKAEDLRLDSRREQLGQSTHDAWLYHAIAW